MSEQNPLLGYDRLLVIVQSTPFCNLKCQYCYLRDKEATKRISLETINNIVKVLNNTPELPKNIEFLWHAGEPLALPTSFYEKIFATIKQNIKDGTTVRNYMQTNGTLISEEWCNFIKRWDVQLGISIDGPKSIHDEQRKDKSNKGTFDTIIKNIGLLKKFDIDFSTITVLTENGINSPNEIWNLLESLKVKKIAFNAEEIEGVNTSSSLYKIGLEKWQAFFERILQLREEKGGIHVRELDQIIDFIKGPSSHVTFPENQPLRIINIDSEGNTSTFSPELLTGIHPKYGDFVFGNVNIMKNLLDIVSTTKFNSIFQEIKRGNEMCEKSCDYYTVCGGGSPSNKLWENGKFDSTETMYCKLRVKSITDIALNHLEEKFGRQDTSKSTNKLKVIQ